MRFRAAVLAEQGKPLVIDEIEAPPLRFGQVLVKIHCSGICGSQVNEIDGTKGPDEYLPHLLGHEATGTVVEIGEGVTTVSPGNRVVCHWRKGTGVQAPPPVYASEMFPRINAGWVTTFSEYSIVSENRVTPVPVEIAAEVGALFGCAATTAMGIVNNDARVAVGESVAVFGAGGVGLNVVQFAAMVSAHPIVAIDLHDHKLELARKLGATHTINARNADLVAAVRAIVGPGGADVTVESTGVPSVIEHAYEAAADRGRVILVGVPPKDGPYPALYTLPLHFEKVLTGSEGGSSRPAVDIPRLVRLCEAGKLSFDGLVSKRYPLDGINDAVDDVRTGRVAGRCMIWMEEA